MKPNGPETVLAQNFENSPLEFIKVRLGNQVLDIQKPEAALVAFPHENPSCGEPGCAHIAMLVAGREKDLSMILSTAVSFIVDHDLLASVNRRLSKNCGYTLEVRRTPTESEEKDRSVDPFEEIFRNIFGRE